LPIEVLISLKVDVNETTDMDPLLRDNKDTSNVEIKKAGGSLYPKLSCDEELIKEKHTEHFQFEEDQSSEAKLYSQSSECPSTSARVFPQVLAVLAVSFGCFIHGTSVMYGVVAVLGIEESSQKLKPNSTETVLGFAYDKTEDSAWIIGISAIGMIFGSLLAAPMSNAIGRKSTCIGGIGIVFAVAYLLFVIPFDVSMLYLARLLMGMGLGVSQSISTVYIAEISTPNVRGNLAVIPAMTGCLGVVTCQVLAKFLQWQDLAIVFATLNIPFVILIILMPESPVYLVSKDKMEEAHRVLRRLRGEKWNVTQEITEIKRITEKTGNSSSRAAITDFFLPHIIKPVVIAFTLMFFFQTSGINLVLTFAPQIFADVTNIDKFLANIFLGCALFASNTLTLLVAGKWPRRMMLLVSSLGCSVTLAVMGLSYQIKDWEAQCSNLTTSQNTPASDSSQTPIEKDCLYNLNWLPILDSMIFIFVFNLGYGSLVWMTVVEILPAHIRNFTNGLTVGWVGVLSFITSFSFPYLLASSWAGQGAFWMYSVISFCGFIFIAICVPETRGKTEEQIRVYFQSKKNRSPQNCEL